MPSSIPRRASAALLAMAIAVSPSVIPATPALARTAPADQIRNQQWALGPLQVPKAWRHSKGTGVTIAVLDTGVDRRHPDLTGQVIRGSDFTDPSGRTGGKFWGHHGTAMASIIAGHGHEGGGVIGIAPEARILSIRVTWENNDPAREQAAGSGQNRDAVAQGIREAADRGAQVISMSLGGGKQYYNGNPAEEEAIKYARSKGAVLIASAGNDGAEQNRRNYPAAYPGVIAVGAVDRALQPTRFTNRHSYVALAAPGVDIVSADARRGYVLGTGTSPATAFVSGVAALIRSRYPGLTPDQVRQALEEGVTHQPPNGRSSAVGVGITNAIKALNAASRINRSESGESTESPQPAPLTDPAPAAEVDTSTNGLIVWVLIGCAGLVLAGLVLGRRRRDPEEESPFPAASPAPETTPDLPAVPLAQTVRQPQAPPPVHVAPWQSIEITTPAPNGSGNGGDALVTRDFVPSPDVGTPLAEQSWANVNRQY